MLTYLHFFPYDTPEDKLDRINETFNQFRVVSRLVPANMVACEESVEYVDTLQDVINDKENYIDNEIIDMFHEATKDMKTLIREISEIPEDIPSWFKIHPKTIDTYNYDYIEKRLGELTTQLIKIEDLRLDREEARLLRMRNQNRIPEDV